MYKLKKKWFTGVKDLTIVTPSNWLAGLVKQSFLKDYPVKVIHNGIDLSVFKPTIGEFKQKYGIPEDKFVLLGVAFGWGMRKGLDVFIELQKRLEKAKSNRVGGDRRRNGQAIAPGNYFRAQNAESNRACENIYRRGFVR